ncbi:MAG: hypothetical protein MI802_08010 [Desulfobacterales bacterium]|nr:hypothetical protein [Desulfobacterales bacterium]
MQNNRYDEEETMTQANTLTIDELIRELDAGRATVKFILKRFNQWLPFDRIDGEHRYSQETLPRLMQIRDWLDNGMLPSQIENRLSEGLGADSAAESSFSKSATSESNLTPEKDIRMSNDALGFIQELFTDIKHHQSRIAVAHEKRAEAEERKAVAIEKRAEAEEKKAAAMNNIASALQEMNRQRAADISPREMDTGEIAAQTARALTMNEADPAPDTDTFDDIFDDDGADLDLEELEAAFDAQESREQADPDQQPIELEDIVDNDVAPNNTLPEEVSDTDEFDIDDISLPLDLLDPEERDEVDEPGAENEQDIIDLDSPLDSSIDSLDDLSALIDTVSETIPETEDPDIDHLDDLLGDDPELPELDDLFAGGEEAPTEDIPAGDLDDLSSLIDTSETTTEDAQQSDLDDLSSLLDHPISQPESDLDDLSLLVEPEENSNASENLPADLDDLSLLVDTPKPAVDPGDLDDLSLLVETPQTEPISHDMDDLSLLVEAPGLRIPPLIWMTSPCLWKTNQPGYHPVQMTAKHPQMIFGRWLIMIISEMVRMPPWTIYLP